MLKNTQTLEENERNNPTPHPRTNDHSLLNKLRGKGGGRMGKSPNVESHTCHLSRDITPVQTNARRSPTQSGASETYGG